MGKRKSAKPLRPKTKDKLDVIFNCPFCNHSKCVETRLDRRRALGILFCRVCNANYAIKISALTEPIDIYSEWIDRCEEQNTVGEDNVASMGNGEWEESDKNSEI